MSETIGRYVDGRHTCKPRKYAKVEDLPDTPEAKSLVLGVEDCLRTGPLPQVNKPNFTGMWEDEGHGVSVAINHAGDYLSLWVSVLRYRKSYQYLGKGTTPNFEIMKASDVTKPVGVLGFGPDGRLSLDLRKADWDFVWSLTQIDTKARLSDRALRSITPERIREVIRRVELAPPPRKALAGIEEVLTGKRMQQLLAFFFSKAPDLKGQSAHHNAAAAAIDEHLDEGLRSSGWPIVADRPPRLALPDRGDDELYRRHVRTVTKSRLFEHHLPEGFMGTLTGTAGRVVRRPFFDWFQDVRAMIDSDKIGTQGRYPVIKTKKLGLTEKPGSQQYMYEVEVTVSGAEASFLTVGGVGAFAGQFKVREIAPEPQERWWRFGLAFATYSLGAGKGSKFVLHMKGHAIADQRWSEMDFPGSIEIYDAGVDVGKGIGTSKSETLWYLHGSGSKVPLEVPFAFTGFLGGGLKVGLSAGGGAIRKFGEPLESVFDPPKSEDYAAKYTKQGDVHFDLGSATLTPKGRDIIGWMCAEERAAFGDARSTVRLIGSADRVDRRWFNEALTKMRADNTAQALNDALGPALQAELDARGYGEAIPFLLGQADDLEEPGLRRVFVELDGHSLTTLRGAESA